MKAKILLTFFKFFIWVRELINSVRSVWNEVKEKWYFVVEDVIAILTDSKDPKQYIKRMRMRDSELSKGWVQFVPTLKVETKGGLQKIGVFWCKGFTQDNSINSFTQSWTIQTLACTSWLRKNWRDWKSRISNSTH